MLLEEVVIVVEWSGEGSLSGPAALAAPAGSCFPREGLSALATASIRVGSHQRGRQAWGRNGALEGGELLADEQKQARR